MFFLLIPPHVFIGFSFFAPTRESVLDLLLDVPGVCVVGPRLEGLGLMAFSMVPGRIHPGDMWVFALS